MKRLKENFTTTNLFKEQVNSLADIEIPKKKTRNNSYNPIKSQTHFEESLKVESSQILENKCSINCQNIPYLTNCEDQIKEFVSEISRLKLINSSLMIRIKNTEEMFSELLKEKNYILSQFRSLLTKTKKQDRAAEIEKVNMIQPHNREICFQNQAFPNIINIDNKNEDPEKNTQVLKRIKLLNSITDSQIKNKKNKLQNDSRKSKGNIDSSKINEKDLPAFKNHEDIGNQPFKSKYL